MSLSSRNEPNEESKKDEVIKRFEAWFIQSGFIFTGNGLEKENMTYTHIACETARDLGNSMREHEALLSLINANPNSRETDTKALNENAVKYPDHEGYIKLVIKLDKLTHFPQQKLKTHAAESDYYSHSIFNNTRSAFASCISGESNLIGFTDNDGDEPGSEAQSPRSP